LDLTENITWVKFFDEIYFTQRTFRNGMTNGRSGKLVACWSFAWNSSTDNCEFCRWQNRWQRRNHSFIHLFTHLSHSLTHRPIHPSIHA